MSLPVIFAPGAFYDLNELELYLARRFFPKNAERYVAIIVAACVSIAPAHYEARFLTAYVRVPGRSGLKGVSPSFTKFKTAPSPYWVVSTLVNDLSGKCQGDTGAVAAFMSA